MIRGRNLDFIDNDKVYFGTPETTGVRPVWLVWTGSQLTLGATDAGTYLRLANVSLLHHEITDPGDAGAVPVTDSGFCNLVTAGAETRTMAIPAAEGLEITINMLTDGGNGVLTVASAVNATGNNTLTFGATSDVVRFLAVDNGGTLAWRIIANDGVALSTV
jgi:hypothetical protein